MNMKPLNGADVLAALYSPQSGSFTILVDWRGEFVTAKAKDLESPDWFWGHYFQNYSDGEKDWLERAELTRK